MKGTEPREEKTARSGHSIRANSHPNSNSGERVFRGERRKKKESKKTCHMVGFDGRAKNFSAFRFRVVLSHRGTRAPAENVDVGESESERRKRKSSTQVLLIAAEKMCRESKRKTRHRALENDFQQVHEMFINTRNVMDSSAHCAINSGPMKVLAGALRSIAEKGSRLTGSSPNISLVSSLSDYISDFCATN
jgi:hypothetical protein